MSRAKLFFLIAVALLPVQLNKYFFNPNSFVFGIPIDYLAPTVYLSDIAILLTIATFLWETKTKIPKLLTSNPGYTQAAATFVFYLAVSALFFSQNSSLSAFFTLKVLEMALFSIVAAVYLKQKDISSKFSKILKLTLIWQGALAICQFGFQKSLGLYFIGERSFDISTAQVASSSILGTELLRSYGSFPHPNVLAAFLLISTAITAPKIATKVKNGKFLALVSLDNSAAAISALAILTTFSKTAIILSVVYLLIRMKNYYWKVLTAAVSSSAAILYLRILPQTYIESLAERVMLSQVALDIAKNNILFGVGSLNFIPNLAQFNLLSIGQVRLLQPVHNVFLLVLVENGILGLILFSILIFTVIHKPTKAANVFLSLALLTYLTVDHFLWTLQQGQMLFFITLAVVYSSKK